MGQHTMNATAEATTTVISLGPPTRTEDKWLAAQVGQGVYERGNRGRQTGTVATVRKRSAPSLGRARHRIGACLTLTPPSFAVQEAAPPSAVA